MSKILKLQRTINYSFSSEELLTLALTHRSFSSRNNERLEFLGDAILNYVIAEALYQKFSFAAEGELSRLRSGLVKRQTLAEVAREIELGSYLLMGSGELKSGGFNRESILSDALEAVFGAIIIDSSTDAATKCILSLFKDRLARLSPNNLRKDAKSRLQELLQSRGKRVPDYVLVRQSGKSPHQKFEVECRTEELEPVSASGSSIRNAEQSAAESTLTKLEDKV